MLFSSMAKIFRGNNLASAREVLDILSFQHQRGHSMTMVTRGRVEPVSPSSYRDGETLYSSLVTASCDYRIRVEHPRLILFSTDRDWLLNIRNSVLDPLEFWEPDSKYLSLIQDGETEIVNKSTPYKYKVYIKDTVDPSLGAWIIKNPDKASAGDICLQSIKSNYWCGGFYFYVKDEKVLSLISFMMGTPQRITKIVSKQDLDK
jgi:hypothetical protein